MIDALRAEVRHPGLRRGAPFTLHSTPAAGVPLEQNGDFRIDDVLTPAPPFECVNPVHRIRNPAGSWFAAGIVKSNDDDN